MIKRNSKLLLLILIPLAPAYDLPAQEGPLSLEFSFSNPGARSMGFGGAFVALADDATAAFANPAGLVQLIRSEISIEGRRWSYSTPFTSGGRISGQPTGILLDDTAGLRTDLSSQDLSGLSFLSFVYPWKDWSLAFYRHELANFENFTQTQGFFGSPPDPLRFEDFRRLTDLKIVTYAAAAGYRLTDSLSLGLALTRFESDILIRTERFFPVEPTLPDGPFGDNAFDPRGLATTATVTAEGGDWGFNAGFLWHLSTRWNLGGFYRLGPDLNFLGEDRSGPALETILPSGTLLESSTAVGQFPDVFGLGVAFKSSGGKLTWSFEWDRVEYSTIVDSLDDQGQTDSEEVKLDDGDEIHLGFEYVFLRSTPIVALRLGGWSDPDHRIRFVGDNALTRAILRGGDDELHFAGGIGLVFRTFQIDMAVDLSDLVDTTSISAIYHF